MTNLSWTPAAERNVDRLTFTGRLRLLPSDAGGRKTAIHSNYRPTFDLGGLWLGRPAVNDARVMRIDDEQLAPGAEGLVRIEPLFPEFWASLRVGAIVPVVEGARVVGHTTIEKVETAEGFSHSLAAFVWTAREFCSFIEEAASLPVPDRMSGARDRLLTLYAAAVGLPAVEPAEGPKASHSPEPPKDWRGFEEFENYWEVFDPYKFNEPSRGRPQRRQAFDGRSLSHGCGWQSWCARRRRNVRRVSEAV